MTDRWVRARGALDLVNLPICTRYITTNPAKKIAAVCDALASFTQLTSGQGKKVQVDPARLHAKRRSHPIYLISSSFSILRESPISFVAQLPNQDEGCLKCRCLGPVTLCLCRQPRNRFRSRKTWVNLSLRVTFSFGPLSCLFSHFRGLQDSKSKIPRLHKISSFRWSNLQCILEPNISAQSI